MAFINRKPRKQLRQKPTLSPAEDEEDGAPPISIKNTAPPAQPARKAPSAALLSFDDDDPAALAPKKPTSKTKDRKPGRAALRVPGLPDDQPQPVKVNTQVSGAGEYSRERLQQLAAATKSLPTPKAAPDAFVLAGSFKAAKEPAPEDDRFAYNPAALLRHTPAASKDPDAGFERPTRAKPKPPPAAVPVDAVPVDTEEDADEGGIPDADTIKRAKAQRERLRAGGAAPDYVSLTIPEGGPRVVGEGPVHSDDEDPAEANLRIRLAQAMSRNRHQDRPTASDLDHPEAAASDDEDFAQQQIRKGLGGGVPAPPKAAAEKKGGRMPGGGVGVPGGGRTASDGAAQAVQALREGVQRLQAGYAVTARQQAKSAEAASRSAQTLQSLQTQLERAGARYQDVQQLRAYVADLCDMLQDRTPYVEVLEEESQALATQRSAAYASRTAAQRAEEAELTDEAARAALGALSQGGDVLAVRASAEAALASAEAGLLGRALPVVLDEFGRDENMAARLQLKQRLQRQRAAAEALAEGMAGEASLGDCTTDESDSEVSYYVSKRRDIVQAAEGVLADASEEFGSVAAVKAQLEAVKAAHPDVYRDAYLGDSAPALFAPFVRLQLLAWDPLYAPGDGFGHQAWFAQLFDYGLPPQAGQSAQHAHDDVDQHLVPALVAKVVLPVVLQRVRDCWSPTSVRQSRGVAVALEDLAVFDLANQPAMQELLAVVRRKLSTAVEACTFPPWPLGVARSHPRFVLTLGQRFGRALRVLHSIAVLSSVLPPASMRELALGNLIQGNMVGFLQSGCTDPAVGVSRLCRVLDALPAAWRSAEALRACPGLLTCVSLLSRALHKLPEDSGGPLVQRLQAAAAALGVAL